MPEGMTDAVSVVRGTAAAAAMLHPIRSRLLAALREPGSAASLSRRLGLPRQKVNYHLRELERHDLVELVEERRTGNCTERVLRARASAWVLSPRTMGALAADPERIRDRFSSAYLTALASRAVEELGDLRERAAAAGKVLPTFSLHAEVRFASAADRAAFTRELSEAMAGLVARYHDDVAEGGRTFRFLIGAYPRPEAPTGPAGSRDDPGGETG